MTNYEKLVGVLREIFQIDQADLDFGIYRIMNQKREEINDFLENKLLKQVNRLLEEANLGDVTTVKKELEDKTKQANELGMETIAEIHSHYQTQVEVAKRVNMVYDFALPPLILHSLFNNDVDALLKWLKISPRNCLTVLDTHDGIGIIDAGPMGDKPGLLNAEQIDNLVETMHANSNNESRQATGAAASNVDLYQVNCTYYNALGAKDFDYLLSRAIQFFAPGVPQVYYGGLFACENDMELLAKTNVGRDINRPYLNADKISESLDKPVVKGLIELIKIRNEHPAFSGEFSAQGEGGMCCLTWQLGEQSISLSVDFEARTALITQVNGDEETSISLDSLL